MKQGHYLTIEKAFKNYLKNCAALKAYPFPYTSGIDYTKPKYQGDGYTNGVEQMVMSAIERKDELEKQVRLVKEVLRYLEIEGFGRDRYIKQRYFRGVGHLRACDEVGIAERTGKYWKRDIFEKAEMIGENLGLFEKTK